MSLSVRPCATVWRRVCTVCGHWCPLALAAFLYSIVPFIVRLLIDFALPPPPPVPSQSPAVVGLLCRCAPDRLESGDLVETFKSILSTLRQCASPLFVKSSCGCVCVCVCACVRMFVQTICIEYALITFSSPVIFSPPPSSLVHYHLLPVLTSVYL